MRTEQQRLADDVAYEEWKIAEEAEEAREFAWVCSQLANYREEISEKEAIK